MREIINEATEWSATGEPVALATVVKTWGSAPRKTGAKMALTPSNKMAGSVSGGCVEGAVVEAGVETLASGQAQLLHFGVADEMAWEVGLACGGMIDVFVEPFDPAVRETVDDWVANYKAGVIATVIGGDDVRIGRKILITSQTTSGSIDPIHDDKIVAAGLDALATRKPARGVLEGTELELFYDVIVPPPSLIIVGGVHIAVALVQYAEVLGFKPTIIDPRRAFGSIERFPDVPLLQMWPRKAFEQLTIHETTAVALLTHDPKIDDQALEAVLPSPAFYIGALGSKKTAAKRTARLLENGFSQDVVDKIYGPVGLNISAQTPEEIALAVMSEIISVYRG